MDNRVFKIYKANKKNTGSAAQFSLGIDKETGIARCVFLQMASQTNQKDANGNATFNWKENRDVFKLGEIDIAEILTVLEGRKAGIGRERDDGTFSGLYHENQHGNSSLYLCKGTQSGYFMDLVLNKNGSKRQYKISITNAEGRLLSVLLRRAIEAVYGW
jgi:hypothetical protein